MISHFGIHLIIYATDDNDTRRVLEQQHLE